MFKDLGIDILNSLSFNEIEIIKYIEKNKNSVLKMSIQELSKEVYVSTTTIMRLCKKMNLSGFSELKYVIKDKVVSETAETKSITSIDDIISNTILEVEQTKRMLDNENLSFVADCLSSDKNIHLYSRGLSSMSLDYMYRVLLAMNRRSTFYIDTPVTYAAGQMSENDILFIASASGATKEIIKTAHIAKSNNATVIAISNFDNNPLSKIADINFYALLGNNDFYGLDIKSRLPIFFIVTIILECYINRRNITD